MRAKLEIGRPNDKFEQEADRIAEEALRAPPVLLRVATARGAGQTLPSVQRLCADCEEKLHRQAGEDEDELLQTERAEPGGTGPSPQVESGVGTAIRGSGQPLPGSLRSYFEPRFGHDFGEVRLHTDGHAAESACLLNARAYTVGHHIVFGAGQFAADTPAGRRLLAHELAHVLQQGAGGPAIQRKIAFTDPTPARENPIKRVLSEPTLGYTLPTVNGTGLPDGFNNAGDALFQALRPQQSSYNGATKECRFADFDVGISADVTVITQPTNNRWTLTLPGADIKGIAACHSQSSVPVTMTGKPDGQTIVDLVDQYEQEHVDDLKRLYAKHLKPHFDWLISQRAQGDDSGKCQDALLAPVDQKAALAVSEFLKAWLAAVAARDARGGHTLKNTVRATANCASVTIETAK